MRLRWGIAFIAALATASPAFAGKNNRTEHIEVPGGVPAGQLSRLWSRAKEFCYANEYEEVNEERELRTLICRQDNMSIYLKFDQAGFTIRVQSLFAKTPIFGGIFSSPRNHRQRLIDALLETARGGGR